MSKVVHMPLGVEASLAELGLDDAATARGETGYVATRGAKILFRRDGSAAALLDEDNRVLCAGRFCPARLRSYLRAAIGSPLHDGREGAFECNGEYVLPHSRARVLVRVWRERGSGWGYSVRGARLVGLRGYTNSFSAYFAALSRGAPEAMYAESHADEAAGSRAG